MMVDLVNALDPEKYRPVVGFHTDNFLIPQLRDAGIETHIFDNPKPFSFGVKFLDTTLALIKKPINFFKKFYLPARRYARFLRENKIDLVNVNNSIVCNHTWMLAAKMQGIPCLTHEMGINPRFSRTSQYFGKRLDAIICLSNVIKDNMTKLGLTYPNIHVIHCGVDLKRYVIKEQADELRKKYDIESDAPIIGVVGNVKWWKGQETIVRATVELVKKYPNIRCMLVGDAPPADQTYKELLEKIISDAGIERNVIFTGFQTNPIDYMNLMDVVVHTSVLPEPFGIVTLEAMSLSKPLVSTTIGGPTEVVESGKSGILVDPGEPGLLSEALDKLLSDPEYAATIGKNGFERLQSNFTLDENVKRTMEVYDNIFATQTS